MVFINILIPSRLMLKGPITPGIGSAPAIVEHHPSVGILNAVGLNPYMPQFPAGLLILPIPVNRVAVIHISTHLQYHFLCPNNSLASQSALLRLQNYLLMRAPDYKG